MRRLLRYGLPGLMALGLAAWSLPAGATHSADKHKAMELLFTSPNSRINSDLAFWGNHAFAGFYRNDQSVGGFRIFDISNPATPQLLRTFSCDGLQADPIVWDRNGNGIADLLLLAVDRTMDGPQCGAARSTNHNNPTGWEGVRVFTLSDDPANPFATIEQVKAVYTDCGAHTITLWPGEANEGKLLVYVSSYPLRPGPTCGGIPPPGSTTPPYQNTANPFDEDPGSPDSPMHGVIQVIEVPLDDPSAANESAQQPPINYPGDPDNQIEWCERGPGACAPGVLEPAARACHDIAVDVKRSLAAAACAEQGQLWEIGANGIPNTANPIWVSDDEVSSGSPVGTLRIRKIPGAIDFFHSATFSNDASVVNWIDESFAPSTGNECPPTTDWAARPWHPAGSHETGRMFFVDGGNGAFLSDFQVGRLRPEAGAYCSAHMGLPVAGQPKDQNLLVNAWYMGGVDVIDFTKPAAPKEVAFYDMAPAGPTGSDNWSAYSYAGPLFRTGRPGLPVYASDGVHNPDSARGFVVFRAEVGRSVSVLDHLNPQTQE